MFQAYQQMKNRLLDWSAVPSRPSNRERTLTASWNQSTMLVPKKTLTLCQALEPRGWWDVSVRKTTLLLCGSGFMRERPSAVLPVVPTISLSITSCPTDTKTNTKSPQIGQQQKSVFASFMAIFCSVCTSFNLYSLWLNCDLKWNVLMGIFMREQTNTVKTLKVNLLYKLDFKGDLLF